MSLRTEAIRLPSKLAYCVSNQVPHERRSRRDQTSKPLESALSSHGRPLSRSSALADTWEKLLKWRDFHEHASAGVRPSWRVEDVVLLCRFPHDRPFEEQHDLVCAAVVTRGTFECRTPHSALLVAKREVG